MIQDVHQSDVREQSQQLLKGSLKHVRTAALAAALVPLAAVAVSTEVNEACPSAGMICGTVFADQNNNGVQDAGEPTIEGAVVTLVISTTPEDNPVTGTNESGVWAFLVPEGTFTVSVQIPPGTVPSPSNVGDDTSDSDGVSDGHGNSVATSTRGEGEESNSKTDFGFSVPPVAQPGTGTPGYWVNHPEAWPVQSITVGDRTYTKAEAIAIMAKPVAKDKTLTMFSSLVAAKLSVMVGNNPECVASTITAADGWMTAYGPAGSMVHASSLAWKQGEKLHRLMDNYVNGMLCAPHRD
jgi:SdrD B-like domain